MSRSLLAVVAVFFLAAAAPAGAGSVRATAAPIPDSFIVVLKPDAARSDAEAGSNRPLVATLAQELARSHGGQVESVYQYALKGFAVRMPAGR